MMKIYDYMYAWPMPKCYMAVLAIMDTSIWALWLIFPVCIVQYDNRTVIWKLSYLFSSPTFYSQETTINFLRSSLWSCAFEMRIYAPFSGVSWRKAAHRIFYDLMRFLHLHLKIFSSTLEIWLAKCAVLCKLVLPIEKVRI